jgi:hypothetical protein
MTAPLRRYAAMSDEVEHLDSELSESLVKIRADIEVCVFLSACVCARACACSHKHVHTLSRECPEHPADDVQMDTIQKLDWDTKQAGAPAHQKKEEIMRIKIEIDKARAVLQNYKVEVNQSGIYRCRCNMQYAIGAMNFSKKPL